MKKLYKRLRHGLVGPGVLCVGLAAAGTAHADTYNLFLKAPGTTTPVTCATGGFDFTKGSGTTATVTVIVNSGCLVQSGTYTGTLSVVVENVTLNGQDQGLNVTGLSGTLPRSAGGNSSALIFSPATGVNSPTPQRPLTLVAANGTQTTGAQYYQINQAVQALPEPSALWLVFAGLGAAAIARRRRKAN